jgi:sulfur relay protein TusB/DsrH
MLHLMALPGLPQEMLERIAAGDDVLLQYGLVWLATQGHADNGKVRALLAKPCRIYVMQDMLQASGIAQESLLTGVSVIDYPGLVALTVTNPVIHTWR